MYVIIKKEYCFLISGSIVFILLVFVHCSDITDEVYEVVCAKSNNIRPKAVKRKKIKL